MKKLFTLSVFALASLTASAQLPVSTQPALKNAVLEEFTGINCVYCPDGHKIAAQITAANPNRAFAINIHTGSFATPSGGQPDFRTADGNAIAAIPGMGITGYPQGAVNRKIYTGTAFAMGRGSWTAAVNVILNQSAYVNVAGQATLDASTNMLTVQVEAYYTANSPVGINKLTVALLQNNINGPQTGAATFNPTMINPDGTYRHMHALRDVITTGATGEDITPTTTGTLITRTINYSVPATIGTIPVDLSNLELIAFVAEGTAEIINVARLPISITGLTTTNNASVLNVIGDDQICISSITPKFTLKNMGNANLTSANIAYSVNGGTVSNYAWSGNITALGSEQVILPVLSGFTLNPTNTLNVEVLSVNGGTDDDPSNNTGAGNFNYTSSSSPTVNLTLRFTQDRYGSETTWKFFDAAGVQVASGGPYLDLAANGTLLHIHNVVLPASGCFRFVIIDSYGDGINSGWGAGNAVILDGYGTTIYTFNGVFTSEHTRFFDVTGTLNTGIEENEFVNNFNIFPNPVHSQASVEFNLTESSNVVVKVMNAVGQVVFNDNIGKLAAGNHSYVLDATNFRSGLYFVEIGVGNSTITRKISVTK
jgi:filamentous hemagglutinin family protein